MIKTYNFTRYTGNYTRGDTKISINKSGLIRLSSGFCRITNVNTFKYVILFFDIANKAIALKFTNNKEDGIFSVTKDRAGATISAKSFMRMNNISLKTYNGRYECQKRTIQDIGEVYIIELDKK